MKKRIGIITMITGVFMLVCSFLLIFYNSAQERHANYALENIQPSLEKKIDESIAGKSTTAAKKNSTIEIEGNFYIGYLKIPALGLKLPVMQDWNYDRLQIAPCRYSGNVENDNIVIAAHNYQRHFGRILTLTKGAKVEFVDASGYSFAYEVSEVTELQATAVEEMVNSNADLTLFTCTYGGVARVTVRCRRLF